jgi:hypothetical protein
MSSPETVISPPRARSRTYEPRKRRTRLVREFESRSPLNDFFTRGVELDDRVDLELVRAFTVHFQLFLASLRVPPEWGRGVELKFRRLGRHRADGMYYPERPVLLLDPISPRSFAHEFGHLLDYRADPRAPAHEPRPVLSAGEAFRPFRERMLERMRSYRAADRRLSGRRGRVSWAYFASRSECFARAFEQLVADVLPAPCLVARERKRYSADPLFFEEVPGELRGYFRAVLMRPVLMKPCGPRADYGESEPGVETREILTGRERCARSESFVEERS